MQTLPAASKFISFILLMGFAIGSQNALPPAAAQTAKTQTSKPSLELQLADAAFHAGYEAAQRGDLATAREDFQKTVKLAPKIAEGHSALGSVLLQLGQPEKAVPELERALALNAADRSAQINLAVACQQTRNFATSLDLFKRLDRDASGPLPANALISYARTLNAAGEPDLALARLQRAVTELPAEPTLHDALGSLLAQRQDWVAAQAQFEQAIAGDPGLAAAYLHLGITLLAQQRSAQAVPILQQAVKLEPGALEAKYQLALALQGAGEEQQSIPLFQQVVDAQPGNAPALTNLALALVQTGKSREAIPLYQRALSATPKDPLVHQDLGVAYLQQSDLDDAIGEFRSGLLLAPDAYELHYNLGLALKLKDDVPAAAVELQNAARLNPASPDPPYTLGILDMQTGNFDESVKQLKLTLDLRPENGDAWALLGSVYKQQDNLPEAASALREAVRLLPNQPGPHVTLAGVLTQQGRKEEAAAERRIAADLTKVAVNRQRATFAANTGNLLLRQGKIADAIERFEDATASDPAYIDGHRGLAEAFHRAGRQADAEIERQKVAQLEKIQP